MIMVIRHAEKPADSADAHGITRKGHHDRHSLTVDGWVRAGALVGLFAPARGEPPSGLCRPGRVYGSDHPHEHHRRPVQTVVPLAAALGVEVRRDFGAGDENALVDELTTWLGEGGDAALVSWQHDEIPRIAHRLGVDAPAHWPDDRYDLVWTFTPGPGGRWRFGQVPQLLLAGDRAEPIT